MGVRDRVKMAAERLWHNIQRRPVRFVEVLVGAMSALGIVLSPEVVEAFSVWGVATIAMLEVVQRDTTPTYDPRDDEGRSLVPSKDPHAAHHYEEELNG